MSPAAAPGLQVMVVDDDTLNLRVAARLLRELGHHGVLVNEGGRALRLLEERTFDLVLLDVNMPGMNGQDTLVALRRRPATAQHMAVLMVSGHDDPGTRAHFLALGADGFLTKPLDSAVLAAALAPFTR
ncbi:response regulator [Roseateles sp.]|uniref:response regulator n=1 Tax=Roseateles sp. TaxID=1971397 RepID=UPI0039E905D3